MTYIIDNQMHKRKINELLSINIVAMVNVITSIQKPMIVVHKIAIVPHGLSSYLE